MLRRSNNAWGEENRENGENEMEEYDLDGVTAKLAAMEAKRKKWRDCSNNSIRTPTEQLSADNDATVFQGSEGLMQQRGVGDRQLKISERASSEFELAPADLSSGESEVESGDEQHSNSTNSLPSDNEDSRFDRISKCRDGRGRMQNLRVKDSLDLSMSVSISTENFKSALRPELSKTKHRPTGSRLSRREPSVASQQHCYEQAGESTVRNATGYNSRIPKLVQQHRKIKSALQQANTSKRAQDVATQQERASYRGDSSIDTQRARPISAPIEFSPSRLPAQKLRHERSVHEKLTVPKSLQTPSLTANLLEKRPSANSTPSGGYRSARHPPEESTARLKPANSPVSRFYSSDTSIPANKPITTNTVHHAARGITEDIEATSAEEQKLLQSLEKLDRRLSNVSASPPTTVREGGQQSSQREVDLKKAGRRGSPNTTAYNPGAEIHETLRVGAYGGGTHSKSRQPSTSVRSSFLKREELSNGVHKARVRVGGALVHGAAGRNNGTDGGGKHKIVVKKDMAHLLF